MDTDGIRLFVLAAEQLNISVAGRQPGLAPAVASAHPAKLESEPKADLLHRSTRKVSLSIEGAEFLLYARKILAQEDAALAADGVAASEVQEVCIRNLKKDHLFMYCPSTQSLTNQPSGWSIPNPTC